MSASTDLAGAAPAKRPLFAYRDLVAGIAGGIGLVVAGHPLDTVKVRMQTTGAVPSAASVASKIAEPQFKNAFDCVAQTARKEGIRGFFKGMSSPLLGVPPQYAIIFASYGASKRLIQSDPNIELTVAQLALAGSMSGVFSTVVTAPVELVKAKLQVQYALPKGAKAEYAGFSDCAKKVLKSEGVRGIYKGTVATLWRDVPGSAAYFGVYEAVKRSFIPEGGRAADISTWSLLFAGGCGGMANWILIYVPDFCKSRLQTDTAGRYAAGHRGMMQVMREAVAANGVKGLFRGLGPCLARSFPANAACFTCYELCSRYITPKSA